MFFALWPDDDTRARIAVLADRLYQCLDGGGRRLRPQRYHLTLQFLGEHPEPCQPLLDAACRAATRVRVPPFELVLDRAGSFRNRAAVCWLGCSAMPAGLRALREALRLALARESVRVHKDRRFVPHLTLVRDASQPWPETALEEPLCWQVRGFSLMRSDMERQFAYEEVGTWTLG